MRDVIDEPTLQRSLNIEVDTEYLKVLEQDLAQVMQQVETGAESIEEDQHDDIDVKIETLRS